VFGVFVLVGLDLVGLDWCGRVHVWVFRYLVGGGLVDA